MVPKIIHLCWFSGDEYPDIIRKCIDSWQRVLPDFEIKIWTREMLLKQTSYMSEKPYRYVNGHLLRM